MKNLISKKKILFIKKDQINKIIYSKLNNYIKAHIISSICRLNTLSMIKYAGSGHLGTSMSAMDLMVWIKIFHQKKTKKTNLNRDIFFSSKGHDAPALYSVLYALGNIPFKSILNLRRLKGLEGHPDRFTDGIEANTGSLGMGISKAKGISWAKKYLKKSGKVIVLTGDGELQEGQIYESLQTAYHQKIDNLVVIIDHNKIQSSQYVKNIINLLDLESKLKSFGWNVLRINGHNFKEIDKALVNSYKKSKVPRIIIADTIKGKGIKKIEHIRFMKKNNFYTWHSGAPSDMDFSSFQSNLADEVNYLTNKYLNINLKIFSVMKRKSETNVLEIH